MASKIIIPTLRMARRGGIWTAKVFDNQVKGYGTGGKSWDAIIAAVGDWERKHTGRPGLLGRKGRTKRGKS